MIPSAGSADVTRHLNPQTGLSSWKAQENGFSLELIQIVPDYVRAVYASRGLPPEVIEEVAGYCVFGTIIRNESDAPLNWRLTDWRYVTPDGETHRLKPKSEWVRAWRERGLAFRWTLLADEQNYAAGDWGQGFITLKLEPGDTFDLQYSWSQNDASHTGTIRSLRCAPDLAPE
ncbi:MAG: hypothetical protein PVI91_08110 [Gammaproteobacteria bacterium]